MSDIRQTGGNAETMYTLSLEGGSEIAILISPFVSETTIATMTELNKQLKTQLQEKGITLDGEIVLVPKGLSNNNMGDFLKELEKKGVIERTNALIEPSTPQVQSGHINLTGYHLRQENAANLKSSVTENVQHDEQLSRPLDQEPHQPRLGS